MRICLICLKNKPSHSSEDKHESEIDPHSGVEVGEVEPVGEMADDVGNDGGQVLRQKGAYQVPMEPEARYNLAMTMVLILEIKRNKIF